MIKISTTTSATGPVTKKALRGGANKWNLNHLPGPEPQVVQKTFTQVLVPLAKAMAGTMVPWSELSVVHVQSLVDKAFGENVHTVERDDVWCGLVGLSIHHFENSDPLKIPPRFLIVSIAGETDLELQPPQLSSRTSRTMKKTLKLTQ